MSDMQPARRPISRITPYTLETDDLDAVTAFYSGALGLEVSMRHDGFVGFRSEQHPTGAVVSVLAHV